MNFWDEVGQGAPLRHDSGDGQALLERCSGAHGAPLVRSSMPLRLTSRDCRCSGVAWATGDRESLGRRKVELG